MRKSKKRYVIRTILPAIGYLAVWSHAVDNAIEVETRTLDFSAVADVQYLRDGEWVYDDWEVVGIELGEGYFDVVTDCENCHGIVRQGATWEYCVSLLPTELQRRAVPAST